MEIACKLLQNADISLTEIADALGYSNGSAFTRVFKKYFGVATQKLRAEHLPLQARPGQR